MKVDRRALFAELFKIIRKFLISNTSRYVQNLFSLTSQLTLGFLVNGNELKTSRMLFDAFIDKYFDSHVWVRGKVGVCERFETFRMTNNVIVKIEGYFLQLNSSGCERI